MDDIDRAAGVEHRCRRIFGMNVDVVEKTAQITRQLAVPAEHAAVALAWISQTESDRAADNVKRALLFAESGILADLDQLPSHVVAHEIDRLNTIGRRLRGEFFLGQVGSSNTVVRGLLMSAIAEHVPQMNARQYQTLSKNISSAEFREHARKVYESMTAKLERNDSWGET